MPASRPRAATTLPSLALLVSVACGGGGRGGLPRLDPARLPVELHGLVPGVSGEPEVMAVWPDAQVRRDRAFGGSNVAAIQGWPAVVIDVEATRARADLIERDGALRLVQLKVPVTRPCTEVIAAFGTGVRPGACGSRVPGDDEQVACALTPDGKHTIGVRCRASGWLDLLVDYPLGHYGD